MASSVDGVPPPLAGSTATEPGATGTPRWKRVTSTGPANAGVTPATASAIAKTMRMPVSIPVSVAQRMGRGVGFRSRQLDSGGGPL